MPGNVPSVSGARPTLTEADLAWIERQRPRLLAADALFVVDFGGVRADHVGIVKRDLARCGAKMIAARNVRLRALAEGTPLEALLPDFSGPTALVTADERWRSAWQILYLSALAVRRLFFAGRPWAPGEIREIPEPIAPVEPLSGDVLRTSASALGALSDQLRSLLQGPPLPHVSGDELSQPVEIEDAGSNRVAVMRALRLWLGCSLQEAKSLVDRAPIAIDVHVDALGGLCRDLRAAGAVIREPPSNGSLIEPPSEEIFALLPGLSLREGYRLRSALFVSQGGRHSQTWAEGAGGLRLRIGVALVSDGQSESWLHASLLLREIGDFAAAWHGISWRAHRVVGVLPDEGLRWLTEPLSAEEMAPAVARHDDGSREVRFCTRCRLGGERVLLHIDRYPPGSLDPQSRAITLAEGGPGYVP